MDPTSSGAPEHPTDLGGFVEFLRGMARSCREEPELWGSGSIDAYLEAWAANLEDSSALNAAREADPSLTSGAPWAELAEVTASNRMSWSFVAEMLRRARVYE